MFRLITLAITFALLSLAALPGGRVVEATQSCPANPSPPDAADPSMILNQPAEGDTVTSPVHIEGLARVFEANVRITVYSASGMVLEDTFTTAAEAGPALAPFEADVPFTVLVEQAGCIRVWEESAADGSPRNVVQVEVNLSPAAAETPTATPAPLEPPNTGDAGLVSGGGGPKTLAAIVSAVALLLGVTVVAARRA